MARLSAKEKSDWKSMPAPVSALVFLADFELTCWPHAHKRELMAFRRASSTPVAGKEFSWRAVRRKKATAPAAVRMDA
jgi:hypothetical protein